MGAKMKEYTNETIHPLDDVWAEHDLWVEAYLSDLQTTEERTL
jgi:hypothetical protein